MKNNQTLAQGNVFPRLVAFTFPILLSILLQTTYGTADLLIVGQFASVNDASGVTIGSPVAVQSAPPRAARYINQLSLAWPRGWYRPKIKIGHLPHTLLHGRLHCEIHTVT